MHVHICMYACICIYTHTHTYTRTHARTHARTHTHTHTHTHMYIIYTHTHARTHTPDSSAPRTTAAASLRADSRIRLFPPTPPTTRPASTSSSLTGSSSPSASALIWDNNNPHLSISLAPSSEANRRHWSHMAFAGCPARSPPVISLGMASARIAAIHVTASGASRPPSAAALTRRAMRRRLLPASPRVRTGQQERC